MRDREATDEPLAFEPTLDGDPLLGSPAWRSSFEHRRIVDVARWQLFGRRREGGERALRIGRYAIDRHLGSGGMGDVYLAHDDALDRKVAVKRVRVGSGRDQERLRREARALARLSHPNVVQVYEVDEHEGRTFLAMEYVAGQTLGAWLSEARHPWREVLEVFLSAGRGLAAAHAAGLVHRDFKPDNVLLGHDGSVRVADFGLVLAGEDRRAVSGDAHAAVPAETRMSVAGAVLGTIRYMPLEQLLGREVDARSDQFSFCVSLYEAMWGELPFSLTSSLARLTALQASEPQTPRARTGSRPPAALWRVIERGLRREPAERWPDMATLLAALEGVTRRRRRLLAAGAAVVVAVGLGAMMATRERDMDPCTTVAHELEGTWDESRQASFASRVAELTASHVGDSEQRIVAGLDRWSEGWIGARTQLCLAQAELRIEPEQARSHNACLARQRQRVSDLVDLLLQPQTNADALAGAVDAVAELPPASACEDELAWVGPPLPTATIAAEVGMLRRDVDRAHELRLLGRVEEGLALAERSEAAAQSLGYGPLLAEALTERARAEAAGGSLTEALKRLEQAVDAAELYHHDRLAAELWTELALRTLVDLENERAGAWQLRRAEVSNGRIDPPPRSLVRLVFARGRLAQLQGDMAEAEQRYRAALAQAEQDGSATPDVPAYWSSLAHVVSERDPTGDEALGLHERALSAAEEHYGPSHPQTAQRAYLLALALERREPERATALFQRAAEIWTTSHAHPHQELANARFILARFALKAGDLDGAEAEARALDAIAAQALPSDHVDRGNAAQLLAIIHAVRGEHAESIHHARAALAQWEPKYGLGSHVVQRLRSDIAASLLALGRLDEADDELAQLLPHVTDGPEEASVRLRRCESALRRGRLDEADAELRALELRPGVELGAHELSRAILRALVDLRRGELRPAAQGDIRTARADTPFTSSQVAAWLEQLGATPAERAALSLD